MARLFVVGTPIGNLGDITLRALDVLRGVDVIVCEDTRVTKRLLDKYDIKKPLKSYHAQSGQMKVKQIIDLLESEKDIALVSDAGTPTISDPGVLLVQKIKKELPEVEIITIPGASALTSALSISGLSASDFLFLGFLPHKKGRETLFNEIKGSKRTVVFYESTHRIIKTLEKLSKILAPSRKIVVARELTKIYEECISGTPTEIISYFHDYTAKQKGEFVVLVEGA